MINFWLICHTQSEINQNNDLSLHILLPDHILICPPHWSMHASIIWCRLLTSVDEREDETRDWRGGWDERLTTWINSGRDKNLRGTHSSRTSNHINVAIFNHDWSKSLKCTSSFLQHFIYAWDSKNTSGSTHFACGPARCNLHNRPIHTVWAQYLTYSVNTDIRYYMNWSWKAFQIWTFTWTKKWNCEKYWCKNIWLFVSLFLTRKGFYILVMGHYNQNIDLVSLFLFPKTFYILVMGHYNHYMY